MPAETAPTPTALADWSPPPATTGVPAAQARGRGGRALTIPVTSGPSKVGGSQVGVDAQGGQDLR